MKFRAVLVPAAPREPQMTRHGVMQIDDAPQTFAQTRDAIRRAVDGILDSPGARAGDRVDVYLITETLVESFTKEKD